MEKTIQDFTIEELTNELNRRYALEAKRIYEKRTNITSHIRKNSAIYTELADIMENENLKETIRNIVEYTANCVDITILIEDGKAFLDAIMKDGHAIWHKHEPKPVADGLVQSELSL